MQQSFIKDSFQCPKVSEEKGLPEWTWFFRVFFYTRIRAKRIARSSFSVREDPCTKEQKEDNISLRKASTSRWDRSGYPPTVEHSIIYVPYACKKMRMFWFAMKGCSLISKKVNFHFSFLVSGGHWGRAHQLGGYTIERVSSLKYDHFDFFPWQPYGKECFDPLSRSSTISLPLMFCGRSRLLSRSFRMTW